MKRRVKDKMLGAIMGTFVGDALGAVTEFVRPQSIDEKVVYYRTPYVHQIPNGCFTDDGELTLATMASIINRKEFDKHHVASEYVKWLFEGKYTTLGLPFDVGITTSQAIGYYKSTGTFINKYQKYSAGNGGIVRLAPIFVFYARDPKTCLKSAIECCKITHIHPDCVDCVKVLYSVVLGNFYDMYDKSSFIPYKPFDARWCRKEFKNKDIYDMYIGKLTKYNDKRFPSPYVVEGLAIALHCFRKYDNFHDGLVDIVNRGGDADSVGALYGMIAGSYYGITGIPKKLITGLYKYRIILKLAYRLVNLA